MNEISNGSTVPCLVCGHETERVIRMGAMVCMACKIFYLRHYRRQDGFVCENGDNLCQVEKTERVTSGKMWRFTCKKCRFEKCLNVGMRKKKAMKSSLSSAITEPSTILVPQNFEGNQMKFLKLSTAFNEMTNSVLFNKGRLVNVTSVVEVGQCVLESFSNVAKALNRFLRELPGFQELSLKQRCSCFHRGLGRVATVLFCTGTEVTPYHLNEHNFEIGRKAIPEMEVNFTPI